MRFDLSDDEWALLEPLMPKSRKSARADDRKIMNAIFYVLRTGMPWRDVPVPRFGNQPPKRPPERPNGYSGAAFSCSSDEKNSSAVFVLVCCSPAKSTPTPDRKALAFAATSNASDGLAFVESSTI